MAGIRKYQFADAIVFHKTTAEFGGLSNMAAGYSLNINDIPIPTAEHLYQACRFPHYPEIQAAILNKPSPMTAKWVGRNHIDKTREDWDLVRFKIMQWVLEVKLLQNEKTFGELLKSTGNKAIVELAPKDKIWGAVKEGDFLVGTNALGRLLMFVREKMNRVQEYGPCIDPPDIPDFHLSGHPINEVCNEYHKEETRWSLQPESFSV